MSIMAGSAIKKSIPKRLLKEDEIKKFVNDLVTQREEWNSLKLVVLGHGEIGKTTLLDALKKSKGLLQVFQKVKQESMSF